MCLFSKLLVIQRITQLCLSFRALVFYHHCFLLLQCYTWLILLQQPPPQVYSISTHVYSSWRLEWRVQRLQSNQWYVLLWGVFLLLLCDCVVSQLLLFYPVLGAQAKFFVRGHEWAERAIHQFNVLLAFGACLRALLFMGCLLFGTNMEVILSFHI